MDIEKEAKQLLEDAKKERKEKEAMSKKPEARGAGPASSAEKVKTEGTETDEEKKRHLEEAELIAKKDEELDEASKKRKADILKAKEDEKTRIEAKKVEEDEKLLAAKDDELDDDKKKKKVELVKSREKSAFQKRIDELHGKILAAENSDKTTKAELEKLKADHAALLKQLKQSPEDKIRETIRTKVKKEMSDRITKYNEEDKSLPREERREMTKDELDEWISEEPAAAYDWIAGRRSRREREEGALARDEFLNAKATEQLDRFSVGFEKLIPKHPELDVEKRKKELLGQGKSKEEARKIIENENPKWKAFMEIFESDINKYLDAEDGPMIIAEEMEKRGKPEKKEKETSEVEELKKQVAEKEAEIARLLGLDTDISSTRGTGPLSPDTELDKKREELAESMGLPKDRIREAVKRRKESGRR